MVPVLIIVSDKETNSQNPKDNPCPGAPPAHPDAFQQNVIEEQYMKILFVKFDLFIWKGMEYNGRA